MKSHDRALNGGFDAVADCAVENKLTKAEMGILLRHITGAWLRDWINEELDQLGADVIRTVEHDSIRKVKLEKVARNV